MASKSATLQHGQQFIVGDCLDELALFEENSVDLIVSSPPYNIGKIYEKDQRLTLDDYLIWQTSTLKELFRVLKPTGSICWQTGTHVGKDRIVPLDVVFLPIMEEIGFQLRNRVIWRFNFGLNSDKRFSGRYETLLWLTKSKDYRFNLDRVRIPQLYPGKRHSSKKADRAGMLSGNPKGKNPSDFWEFDAERDFRENPIWDIPNVKNNHPEKTKHPCQFPIELAERCILAFSSEGDVILDPFVGVGATVLAAQKHNRCGIGIDKDAGFIEKAIERSDLLTKGLLKFRQIGTPVARPKPSERVAVMPEEWMVDVGEKVKES